MTLSELLISPGLIFLIGKLEMLITFYLFGWWLSLLLSYKFLMGKDFYVLFTSFFLMWEPNEMIYVLGFSLYKHHASVSGLVTDCFILWQDTSQDTFSPLYWEQSCFLDQSPNFRSVKRICSFCSWTLSHSMRGQDGWRSPSQAAALE